MIVAGIRRRRRQRRAAPPSASGRLRVVLVLIAGLVTPWAAPAAAATLSGIDGQFIEDPVFGGKALVYEGGNREHPTVVLVHGLGADASRVWGPLVAHLRDGYHILAFDLPGFGGSTGGNRPYTPDRYVRFLDHVIDHHAGDKAVTLLGHSLGGALSLRYAAKHPDRIERLLLTNVAGILHRSAYAEHLVRVGPDGDGQAQGDTPSGHFLDRLSGALIRKGTRRFPDAERILESPTLRRAVLRGDPRLIAGLGLAVTDFSDTLQAIDAPTTLYWGGRDQVTPMRIGRVLANELTAGHLHVFEESGHTPMLDRPSEFNDLVRAALETPPPAYEPREPAAVGDRQGVCRDASDQVFEGAYATIEIISCTNTTLRQVSARSVTIRDSRVRIVDSHLSGDAFGARISGSQVVMTVGTITGDTAIVADRARLDIAGTRLRGQRHVINGAEGGANEITLSVTPVTNEAGTRYLHTIRALSPGERL